MLKSSLILLSAVVLACTGNAASPLIISEFLANNNNSISDEDGDKEDWIEIQNISSTNVNLAGWSLADSTNNLRQWMFPATNIGPNRFVLVFASNKDRRTPGRELHANFRLSNNGEYLALVDSNGVIATEFRPSFPQQVADVSYGFANDSRMIPIVDTGAVARAYIPSNSTLGLLWTEAGFNDSTWQSGTVGIGYDNNPSGVDYNPMIGLNIGARMFNINQTAFARVPFVITNVAELDTLSLTLRWEDGMIAYMNGVKIVEDNAPAAPAFDSGAPANRADGTAITPVTYNVTSFRDFLQVGTNVLAFHILNNGIGSSDVLLFPQFTARTKPSGTLFARYFPVPTPAAANNAGTEVLGPIVTDVNHTPSAPATNETITVTARIRGAFAPFSNARLRYRVMYGAEIEIPMSDNGTSGDGVAGDGVFGAIIPSGIAAPGQMIRWYIRATDTSNVVTRIPGYVDPLNSPEYIGTIVPIAQTNNLEILHWFSQNPTQADVDAGTRASFFFNGEFYDNVWINIHGQSSRGFPKKSYDVDFHRGYNFRWDPNQKRVDDINLLTTYPDKAHLRNVIAYETFRDAGTPYHWVKPVRLHQNGVFFSDVHIVENGDDNYLERMGMDVNGALYKMYNTLNAAAGEKKTRQHEGTEDLQALINGLALPAGPTRNAFLYDNLNIPEIMSYLAAQALTGNTDCCHKNYYLYRDTEGTAEWQVLPWDIDLTFGRVWSGGPTYWDDVLYPDTRLNVGDNNALLVAIYNTPELRQMYFRRLRTLMDEIMQPPGTPANLGRYEQRIDQLVAEIAPDAALDLAKWGTWCCGSGGPFTQANIPIPANYQTMQQAANQIKNSYLPARRTFLYSHAEVPAPQPTNVSIAITGIEYAPATGNQAQEYVEFRNTNSTSIDVSGWRVTGGIDFTFPPGTVMMPNTYLYISPNPRAFRARTTGPRGGQGLLVVGGYSGQLSARGETVQLSDKFGRAVASISYPGTPSLAQQFLRITELMYAPTPLAGNTNNAEEFEYIELENIGPSALDLTGVRFINGVTFDFTGSAVTSLGAGARVMVVKNSGAFTARYGGTATIAGQYSGSLDNSGERLTLVDSMGEEILDFTYNNNWYPITDGLGFSLVVSDILAEADAWALKSNWRASSALGGSPGQVDPQPPVFPAVYINEALTRTLNVPDAIEIYNESASPADISGWFLTDDFSTPKKFRIPNGTTIAAGGYRVFTESNFNANPLLINSFALGSDGDDVYLFGADLAGNLNGFVHGFAFDAAEEGVSFGRHVTSDDREHFVRQISVTTNAANSGPRVGPLVVSEIMYHPLDVGTNDNSADEFIEIRNITGATVALFDPARPTNTWSISGGVQFSFPTNVSLAAGESLLVVNIASTNTAGIAAFRSRYGLSGSVQVYGAYAGKLNNDRDTVTLRTPTPPLTNGVPYAIVDQVQFTDALPWPKAADGFGFSLQRWNPAAFANDAANWITTRPTPGAGTPTNGVTPVINTHPTNQLVLTGDPAGVHVVASGSPAPAYQWFHNGTNVNGGTNASLTFSSVQPYNAGTYEVVVYNEFGAVFSQAAILDVRMPVAITSQPTSVDVRIPPDPAAAPTTNVTFTVQASSSSAINYQWKRNGTNVPGATSPSFTVVDVKTNDLAYFSVVVSDALSTRETTNFWLYPLINPAFVEIPASQSVAVNTPVTLSAQVSGWPPPFTYELRLGTAVQQTKIIDSHTVFFTVTSPPSPSLVSYRVVIRNRARPSGLQSNPATTITSIQDTDGDGIPDEWETRYGFDIGSNADRLGDPDNDGMLNWQEYVAGTDPTNALSVLSIKASGMAAGAHRIEFDAVSNRTYAVQYSSPLTGTNWQTLAPVAASRTNRTQVIQTGASNTNQFYRLVTPGQ